MAQLMSPRVRPRPSPTRRSSFAEFRSQTRNPDWLLLDTDPQFTDRDGVFWKLLTAPRTIDGSDPRGVWLSQEERRTLSKATAAAGANLVPTDFEAEIVQVLRTRSVMARLARTLITNTGTALLLPTTTAHGVATWTAENAGYTKSDETFGQVTINAFKGATDLIVSEELLTDSGLALDEYLAQELGARLAVLADAAYVAGDGSGKPLGIATTGNGVTVVTAATGSATAFKLADIVAVWKSLTAAYRPRATWLVHPDEFANLASLADTAGGLVFTGLQSDTPTIFGRPVEMSPDLAAPAANAKSVVLADLETAYTVRIQQGVVLQRQQELYSDTGQVGFRSWLRTDGRIVIADAARVLAHSAT
jgi:HK97 family phage major capsid protein